MSVDVKTLADRLVAVERLAASVRSGRDGRDGRDGIDAEPAPPPERGERGERGPAGNCGRDGINGVDGKDFDPDALRAEVQHAVGLIPIPRDGLNGANGRHGVDGINGKDGTRGPRGPKGDTGAQGETGPIGPMPAHEWKGTKLRFEDAPGEWGEFTDLRGPRGIGGGGSLTEFQPPVPALLNSYFPNGW